MRLGTRLSIYTGATVVIATASLLVLIVCSINQFTGMDLNRLRAEERARVEMLLKERVTAVNVLMRSIYQELAADTTLNPFERINRFKEQVHRHISSLRYDHGTGYIWVNDMTNPYPRMIMHPTMPHLNGRVLNDSAISIDSTGGNLFHEAMVLSRTRGEGFIEYRWPKPTKDSLSEFAPKLSYVSSFPPTSWVIGSGVYLDDIEAAVMARSGIHNKRLGSLVTRSIVLSLVVSLVAITAILVFARHLTHPIRAIARAATTLSHDPGKTCIAPLKSSSIEEIDELAGSFNRMAGHMHEAFDQLRTRNSELNNAVSRLEHSQTALEESEQRYRQIFQSFQDIYIQTDAEGTITMITPSVKKILGYTPEEVLGTPARDFYHNPSDRDVLQSILQEHGFVHDMEVPLKGADESIVWCSISGHAADDPTDTSIVYEGIIRDISERNLARTMEEEHRKQLLQADKLKSIGTLVAGIAHEINNPLNFIMLASENIGQVWGDVQEYLDSKDEELYFDGLPYDRIRQSVPNFLEAIQKGSDRIGRIISGLKDFSRRDSGSMDGVIDINRVVESAIVITGTTLRKSTEDLQIALAPDLPMVRGNYQQLEQVVVNLLTNASQALRSPKDSIRLQTFFDDGSERAGIEVVDRGEGIGQEDLNRIFDPFFTTRRSLGGTGIGLSISYAIVNDHGGKLVLNSSRQHGTTARVYLPIISGTHALESPA